MSARQIISGLVVAMGLCLSLPAGINASISCDDFAYLEDAQAIIDGLGSDPFSFDTPRGGNAAIANDGILCEDSQTDASLLVPLPVSEGGGVPILSGLGSDALPEAVDTVQSVGVISEDIVPVKDTSGLFDNEYTIELIGVETPGWSRRAPDRDCFGEEAEAQLAELFAAGQTFYLEKDAAEHKDDENVSNDDVALRYVWIQDPTDGRYYLLNGLMVREGIAVVAIMPPNEKYAADLRQAEQEAIAEGSGLWGACVGATYPPA